MHTILRRTVNLPARESNSRNRYAQSSGNTDNQEEFS